MVNAPHSASSIYGGGAPQGRRGPRVARYGFAATCEIMNCLTAKALRARPHRLRYRSGTSPINGGGKVRNANA